MEQITEEQREVVRKAIEAAMNSERGREVRREKEIQMKMFAIDQGIKLQMHESMEDVIVYANRILSYITSDRTVEPISSAVDDKTKVE